MPEPDGTPDPGLRSGGGDATGDARGPEWPGPAAAGTENGGAENGSTQSSTENGGANAGAEETAGTDASVVADGPGGPRDGSRTSRWRRVGVPVAAAAATVAAVAAVGWAVLGGTVGPVTPESDAVRGPAGTEPVADFDGDGTQDVYATGEFGGAVAVVYGHRGDGRERRRSLTLDSPGVPGHGGRETSFADYAVARDFDGDGRTDLAVTVETEDDGRAGAHGDVVVIWGSPDGLSSGTRLQGVPDGYRPAADDEQLVAGDVTGDGHNDLVLRTGDEHGLLKGPFGRDGSVAGRGAVPRAFPGPEKGVRNVTAFAADLNGDGADDLISSHSTEDDGLGGGTVESQYVPGGRQGFGKPETGRLPGIHAATTGDVDKDGYVDVVLHRYPKGETPGSVANGPVEVFPGSADGPDPSRHTGLDRDSPGVPGERAENDLFGEALDAGDVNGDGYADVAVGAHGENDTTGPSSVTVLRGGADGLTGDGARAVGEPPGGRPADSDAGSAFGAAVRLGDTDGDGRADLAVGAPRTGASEGALWLLPQEKDGWPEDRARLYAPDDFDGPDPGDDPGLGTRVH